MAPHSVALAMWCGSFNKVCGDCLCPSQLVYPPAAARLCRFGEFTAPLDEALTHVVLDLSGRAHLSCDLNVPAQRIGTFDTELVEHFFMSWANTSGEARGCQGFGTAAGGPTAVGVGGGESWVRAWVEHFVMFFANTSGEHSGWVGVWWVGGLSGWVGWMDEMQTGQPSGCGEEFVGCSIGALRMGLMSL